MHLKEVSNTDWTCTSSRDPHDIWQVSFPKISEAALVEVYWQTFDDDITLQMISSVYDLEDIWTLDRMPESPPSYPSLWLECGLNSVQSVHLPSKVRHYTQERFFPALRVKKVLENLTLDQLCFQRKLLIKRETIFLINKQTAQFNRHQKSHALWQ